VGATPGGELGGTWTSPTVDATHSGSAHHDAATVNSPLTISTQDISLTVLKDIVTTAPITGGENDVLTGADGDLTIAIDVLKDLVTTSPVTGAENDVFPGSDADVTIALDFTTDWNFGGTSSFEINNAANNTVNAEGETTWDTTKGQLVVYSGTVSRVFYPVKPRCVVIENLAAADDNKSLGAFGEAVTITSVGCSYVGTGTTPAEISLEDGGGNAMTHSVPTCTASGTDFVYVPVTASGSLNAGELLRFDVDNSVDPETDEYTICYEYIWDRQ